MSASCPLYPQKRTWIGTAAMSAVCQKRTFAVSSLDMVSPGPTHLHHPISRNERGRDSLSRMRFDPLTHVAHDSRQRVFSVPFRPNTANDLIRQIKSNKEWKCSH